MTPNMHYVIRATIDIKHNTNREFPWFFIENPCPVTQIALRNIGAIFLIRDHID